MAYFTAVFSPHGSGDGSGDGSGRDLDWRPVDVDLEAGSPDELGDVLRGAVDGSGVPDAPVLAVLEREDEWFAVVRTEGPIDVKVFVSDAVAAAESAYAPLFAELPTAGDRTGTTGRGDEDDDRDDEDDDEDATAAQEPRPEPAVAEDVWAGDPELLVDLGCPADVLLRLSGSGVDPAEATVEIGELLGFADVLESLR